jgi:hypothetical protein
MTRISTHVPNIPPAVRHQLADSIRRHGTDSVIAELTIRAEMFRKQGDEEFAEVAEREAEYARDISLATQ